MELRQVYSTPDGKTFENKKDALDYMRKPKILAAMKAVADGNAELAQWLVDHQEQVEMAFETGTIKRVSKADKKAMAKAMVELKAALPGNFFAVHGDDVLDSFRWPTVKRMDDAEKATVARNTLVAASEGNTDLADWILGHKTDILAAYEAGVEKKQANPKAAEALAAYRAKKAAEKAAAN